MGALTFLIASALAFYFICGCWWAGVLGGILWFLVPWFDILTRVKNLKMPVNNRLSFRTPPSEDYFPNAARMLEEIEEADFEHVGDHGWNLAGMNQYFRIFWHPEAKAVASVCLCEHDNVAFAFATICCRTDDGRNVHTTNYPFSPSLLHPPEAQWRHLPCEKNRFAMIFHDHEQHLERLKINAEDIVVPDPDQIVKCVEKEMKLQLEFNLQRGIIELTGDGHYRYARRGLFFLWKQSMKDMIRLC
ncbi:hypothetical protein N9Z02_00410 [Akkermansiaceae bacterium]|nr:hypothetical protein [Akkermansiaceae bacterium]